MLLVIMSGLSRGLDYHGVMQSLRATPHLLVWISILLTAVSYLALVERDLCALSYVGVQVSTPAVFLASFCGSALGNAVSFKAFTADAVRDRVYGAVGVRPEQTVRVLLFIDVAFGLGLAAFATLESDACREGDGASVTDFDHLDSMRRGRRVIRDPR